MVTDKKTSLVGYGITSVVFLLVFLWIMGVFGSYTGAEMAVWLLGLYMIMPLTSLVFGVVFGMKNAFLKWLYPIVFGMCGFLFPCLATGNFRFEATCLFFSFVPAILGIATGMLVRKARARR